MTEVESDLVEWDYSNYERLRSEEIHAERRAWELFRDDAPGGESPCQVANTSSAVCCAGSDNACGSMIDKVVAGLSRRQWEVPVGFK
jgi:broad specificity phosphatase PhoE